MIFKPKSLTKTEGSFILPSSVAACAHPCMDKDILKEYWYNFSFQTSTLSLAACDELVFSIGNAEKLPLDGHEYSINITADGVCVFAENEQALIRGFMMLLDCFKAIDLNDGIATELACCEILDKPTIQTRMVHFCIFPDTELWQLQRFVRFCGALKYTHIILEFWGMLKYDCLKELAWSFGYSKEQVRPIIKEARDLGMEVIPMFNHWGHASSSRIMHGKHVVLDQNPQLQTYFSDDGWCWDVSKPKVRELFRKVRAELYELCGDGDYFHIGCDEAFTYEQTPENIEKICKFINGLSDELKKENRRAIAWGDMFLYRYPHYNPNNKYACFGASPEAAQKMLELVSRDVLIADWQYYAKEAPIETSAEFLNAGFDCLLCPSVKGEAQLNAVLNTIKEQPALDFMQTTWHELSAGTYYVLLGAVRSYGEVTSIKNINGRTSAAALMRKVMPIHGDYEKAGWCKQEIGFSW